MSFFFCLTNPGLEKSLKLEMSSNFPTWRLAFSAPGFITFKGEGPWPTPKLAKLWGECLGKGEMPGATVMDLGAGGVWSLKIQTPAPLWPHPLQISGLELPELAPSRAWLKIEEAISLFSIPMQSGQKVIELGSSPGGAVHALLNRGLTVIGVDPAKMDSVCLEHPLFTHLQKPFQELTPDEMQGVDWVLSDLNLAPGSVLSHLGRLLREIKRPKGLVITLKFFRPEVAAEIAQHERRVKEWGYKTQVRLLPSHQQEVALYAF